MKYTITRNDKESAELIASKARTELRHYNDRELAERVRIEGTSVILEIEPHEWMELKHQMLAWHLGTLVFNENEEW